MNDVRTTKNHRYFSCIHGVRLTVCMLKVSEMRHIKFVSKCTQKQLYTSSVCTIPSWSTESITKNTEMLLFPDENNRDLAKLYVALSNFGDMKQTASRVVDENSKLSNSEE